MFRHKCSKMFHTLLLATGSDSGIFWTRPFRLASDRGTMRSDVGKASWQNLEQNSWRSERWFPWISVEDLIHFIGCPLFHRLGWCFVFSQGCSSLFREASNWDLCKKKLLQMLISTGKILADANPSCAEEFFKQRMHWRTSYYCPAVPQEEYNKFTRNVDNTGLQANKYATWPCCTIFSDFVFTLLEIAERSRISTSCIQFIQKT